MIKNKFVLFAFVFVFLISFVSSLDISKQAALNEINSSKSIIQDMELHNLSTVFMNDLLIEAQNAYSRAYYAEILLSPNSSAQQVLF